jgi:hypothetical protein
MADVKVNYLVENLVDLMVGLMVGQMVSNSENMKVDHLEILLVDY